MSDQSPNRTEVAEFAGVPPPRARELGTTLTRIASFVALVVLLDYGLGAVLEKLFMRTMSGERGGITNLALSKETDVLILGSSRAQFHVMPSVLAPALSLRVFNAGLKGHDALYGFMLADLWKQRHPAPKAIVMTVDLDTLLRKENELAAAQIFAPFIEQSELVRRILYLGGPYKRVMYLSHAYRYNGKVLSIAKNMVAKADLTSDGFWPAEGVMPLDDPAYGLPRHGLLEHAPNEVPTDALAVEVAGRPFWDAKLRYLKELAEASRKDGTRLFLVHTPIFGLAPRAHDIWTARMRELVASMPGAQFLDICVSTHPREFSDPEVYRDFAHLNPKGAKLFSDILARELSEGMGSASAR